MCAACQTVYQEIRNLFNHANMRAEINNTISNFFITYVHFASTSPPPLVYFHTVTPYPLSERTYFLNDPKARIKIISYFHVIK